MKTFENDKSGGLFNAIIEKYNLKNDRALSEKIGMPTSAISKIRQGHRGLSAENILRINVATSYSIKAIMSLIGERFGK